VFQTIILLGVTFRDGWRVYVTDIGCDTFDERNDIEQGEFSDDWVLFAGERGQ